MRSLSFVWFPLLICFGVGACIDTREEGASDTIPVGITLLSLDPPSLIGPNDGRYIWTGNTVQMRWRSVRGAESYQFELSADSTFSTVRERHILDTTVVRSQPLSGGTYYWRVRARIGEDARSHWSDRRSFWLRDTD